MVPSALVRNVFAVLTLWTGGNVPTYPFSVHTPVFETRHSRRCDRLRKTGQLQMYMVTHQPVSDTKSTPLDATGEGLSSSVCLSRPSGAVATRPPPPTYSILADQPDQEAFAGEDSEPACSVAMRGSAVCWGDTTLEGSVNQSSTPDTARSAPGQFRFVGSGGG